MSAGEMVVRPGGQASSSAPSRVDVTEHDHPLSLEPDSQWQAFFKDNDVLGQIDKDVRWAAADRLPVCNSHQLHAMSPAAPTLTQSAIHFCLLSLQHILLACLASNVYFFSKRLLTRKWKGRGRFLCPLPSLFSAISPETTNRLNFKYPPSYQFGTS